MTAPVPHRYPFRLVERAEGGPSGRIAVVLASAGGSLAGTRPWPVSLLAEALAQAILLVAPPPPGGVPRLVAIDRCELLGETTAGDRLEVEVATVGALPPLRRYSCVARRSGALVARAELTVSS